MLKTSTELKTFLFQWVAYCYKRPPLGISRHTAPQSPRLLQDIIFVLLSVISLLCRLTDWFPTDVSLSLSPTRWHGESPDSDDTMKHLAHVISVFERLLKSFPFFKVLINAVHWGFLALMCYINLRFTYFLTYLLTYAGLQFICWHHDSRIDSTAWHQKTPRQMKWTLTSALPNCKKSRKKNRKNTCTMTRLMKIYKIFWKLQHLETVQCEMTVYSRYW